jgi:hypothetical protein
MRRFREPPRTGSEPVADRFRQPVPGGGLYRPPEPVRRSRSANGPVAGAKDFARRVGMLPTLHPSQIHRPFSGVQRLSRFE